MLSYLSSLFSSRIPTALYSNRLASTAATASGSQTMSIAERVEKSIADNKVTIFTKAGCPYCTATKNLFTNDYPDETVNFVEVPERERMDWKAYMSDKTGEDTFPSIWINQKAISGGNSGIQSLHRNGKLATLLKDE
ncbi:hypothetical protein BDQ12DRAFT_732911 [Crucibulum laeve]|uniref:Glutaredoxin domain-containing protein n=1 Tax=Crucibulum laeve TaxID=68775 RepID=A0A5C3MBD0_9AGAR|nr:hypothetical protein BDQ12DRAFT_732911 [Crucibulum laeve]